MSEAGQNEHLARLIREGVKSYMDALLALNVFRDSVSGAAVKVLDEKAPRLAAKSGVPMVQNAAAQPYFAPDGFRANYDGNWALVAAKVSIDAPWKNVCYLGLNFQRQAGSGHGQAFAIFIYGSNNAALRTTLRSALKPFKHFYDNSVDREVGFYWPVDGSQDVDIELGNLMDYVTDVWGQLGGWERVNGVPGQAG